MKFSRITCAFSAVLFFAGTLFSVADDLAWPKITAQTRPWTWWWWHGGAVDETNLAQELQRFHDAGLGGVQITSIYGVKGGEARDLKYLGPQWQGMLDYTINRAGQLGMGVDMSLGSGWCFGGPTVSNHDANSLVVVKTFDVNGGNHFHGQFKPGSIQVLEAFSSNAQPLDLTSRIASTGEIDWSAPPGHWTVYAVSQAPSGQKVKRAGPGGAGWMLNPLYPQAVRDWLPWFDTAFAHDNGVRPQAVFQDSYEYRTDWAPDFFSQFEKYRGYRLQDELPALFGDTNDEAARVKYDYRLTVSEIMADQSEPLWIDWAHQNGMQTIYQAHGTPGNWLDLYGDADMPETEMFRHDRSVLISKFASSAAHTQGRPLTGAETGTWLKEHFTENLADLKYLADDMFLAGVNRIFYHGACYSPEDAPWPGWVFYAATEMNPRNSIWHDVRILNDYVARCQSVLQSGNPDNDILLYWPVADFWSQPAGRLLPMSVSVTDWFENQNVGRTAHALWNDGYAFDYVSDRELSGAKVADGIIQMPGGDYRIIVVPPCHYLPVETLRTLLSLVQAGATVVFSQTNADVPGWHEFESKRVEMSHLWKQVLASGPLDAGGHTLGFGQGKIALAETPDALCRSALPLLGGSRETMVEQGLSFIRRTSDDGWNYFIANRGPNDFDGWITLGRPVKSVAIMDPLTGNRGVSELNGNGQIHLQLAAGESLMVRGFNRELASDQSYPHWNNWRTNGEPFKITGQWTVHFVQGGPVIPVSFQTAQLGSWAGNADTNTENFAGSARYEITFDAPPDAVGNFLLSLGDVCQSARVTLNGKDYGVLIAPPFGVVVDNLKPAGNKLEVEVTNVSANRIRDLDRRGMPWKIFKDANVVNEDYEPFDASEWPLTPSGLLGPVTLTTAVAGE